MNIQEWAEVSGAMAAWTAILIGVIRYGHSQRNEAARAMEQRLRDLIGEKFDKAEESHNNLTAQIKDIASTVRDNYVPRREFEVASRATNEGLTNLGREVGRVRNSVEAVGRRIDDALFRPNRERD